LSALRDYVRSLSTLASRWKIQFPTRYCDDIRLNGIGQRYPTRKSQFFDWDSVQVVRSGSINAVFAATRAERRTSLASSSVTRALAIALSIAAAALIVVGAQAPVHAELENSVFTAKAERLRIVVPRGWRATDQPSYPGLLLWMMRSEPEGTIVLTDEPFTRDVYCSWPVRCQMSHDALPAKLACALGAKLEAEGLRVGPVQAGPKENEDAGLPSVWFEYESRDNKHYLRQAVAIDEDHVVSLVLSAPTADARTAQVRSFEQALRTLRPLNQQELAEMSGTPQAGSGSGSAGSGAGSAAAQGSATQGSATPAAGSAAGSGSDAGEPPAAARTSMFMSTPAPRIDPIGPCTRR
jgi:hypothetical protein